MATTTNKSLSQPANGSNVNTWDVPMNANFGVIDAALGSVTSLNASSGDRTLTATQYQSLILDISGAITVPVTFTIPSLVGGEWIVYNHTTGAGTVIIASGGGGTSITVLRGVSSTVYSTGSNIRLADDRASSFPAGTVMLFVQTAAPTGWTKSTTHNNKALRVVSGAAGTGGTTAFTSVFTARTISTSNLPAHSHGVTDPGHSHLAAFRQNATGGGSAEVLQNYPSSGSYTTNTSVTGITINNTGGGVAMDFDVQYVDVILAAKD